MAKASETTKPERVDPANRGNTEAARPTGLVGFFQGSREELDKVVWPGRQQLISESVAVLLIVVAFAAFVFLIDQLFSWIAQGVF